MKGFAILFSVAIAADTATKFFDIPVPGSIVGMVALTAWFTITGKVSEDISEAAQLLLRYLALLLVPVGVAVVDLTSGMSGALLKMVGVSVIALLIAVLTTVTTIRATQWALNRSALLSKPDTSVSNPHS